MNNVALMVQVRAIKNQVQTLYFLSKINGRMHLIDPSKIKAANAFSSYENHISH